MPSKYVVRNFTENTVHHVYNRGVEKRNIFLDVQDYRIFLYYLYIYLLPLKEVLNKYPDLPIRLYKTNLHGKVEVLSYCLMPNHFHLLLKQTTVDGISRLLKQLTNAYTLYFNQKYERVGGLMQGNFKSIEVVTDELLLHVSRYIHLNPVSSEIVANPVSYKWSSLREYLQKAKSLCNTSLILAYFPTIDHYLNFVNDQVDYSRELEKIKYFRIED